MRHLVTGTDDDLVEGVIDDLQCEKLAVRADDSPAGPDLVDAATPTRPALDEESDGVSKGCSAGGHATGDASEGAGLEALTVPLPASEERREVAAGLLGVEAGWARGSRMRDASVPADHHETLRPRCESCARSVVHSVDEDRHRQTEPRGCIAGCVDALIEGRLLGDADSLLLVRAELPLVHRVRLGHVDEVERRLVAMRLMQSFDVA